MDAPFASWSPRAEGSRTAAVALAAMVLFAAVWAVLHYGFYADNRIVDTPVYQRYGDAMLDGQVPYDDFSVEYPPAALPVFALPSVIVSRGASLDDYDRAFGFLMAICGAAAIVLVAYALVRDRAGPATSRRRLRVRRLGAARARLGHADPVRPLAGGARGRSAGVAVSRAGPARARRARRCGRGQGLPARAAPALRGLGLAAAGAPRGADRARCRCRCRRGPRRALSRAEPARRLGEQPAPDDPAAPARDARLRRPARPARRGGRRPDDGVQPRLAEPRRDRAGRARDRPEPGRDRRPARDLALVRAAGPRSPTASSAPAPLRSVRSSSSGRCSRRSS